MKKILIIFICLLLVAPALAKDPIKRGKAQFAKDRAYPQLDISGYEELEFNKLDQSGDPKQYQSRTEYTQIPASTKVYDGWRHRRLIDLEGQINEKLYVRYKIFQDPDLPQETDIYVEYDKFSIYFGKYDAALTNGSLFAVNKSIDGLHADYLDEAFQLEAIYGEERSHERTFSFQGTGQREYSLGQANILEGSLKVRINSQDIADSEYSVNYIDGRIVFNRIISALETVEGSYEYLDPIEDFLPISSKVRLTGLQHRYKLIEGIAPVIVTKTAEYIYTKPPEEVNISPWDELASATYFSYTQRALTVTVSHTALVGAKLFINNSEAIPLQMMDRGVWSYSLPTNTMERTVTISYDCGSYSYERGYFIRYVPTVAVQEQPVSVAPTADVLPSTASISVTQEVMLIESQPLAYYQCVFPEGVLQLETLQVQEGALLKGVMLTLNALAEPSVQYLTPEKTKLFKQDELYRLQLTIPEGVPQGLNFCYISFTTTQNQIQVRKVPFFVVPKPKLPILTEITLPHRSLISFTEDVYIDDQQITLNEDYKMNYASGKLHFIKEYADTSKLKVVYAYNDNQAAKEFLKGQGVQGPYQLTHQLLVPDSVEIRVNSILLLPQEDYKVDYTTGKITFSKKLNEVEVADVVYRYYIVNNAEQSVKPTETFSMSSYFVQEKAVGAESGGDTDRVVKDSELSPTFDGQVTIIRIPETYLPMIQDSWTLYLDEQPTTAVASITEYNGELRITGNVTTASISVEFKQAKAAVGPKIYFNGTGGSTVYLQDINPNFPKPIVYGYDSNNLILEKKSPQDAYYVPLEPKKDFIIGEPSDLLSGLDSSSKALVRDNASAWERGAITFITANSSGTGFEVHNQYGPSDLFRFSYRVSSVDRPDPGDILHQTYGTKIQYAPSSIFSVGVEYNESSKKFQRTVLSNTMFVTGNDQTNFQIQLVNPLVGATQLEVVEDSERVYINDRLQTKNDSYYITYKGGLVRFKAGLLIGSKDIVRVEYQFYTAGLGEAETQKEKAHAAKVDTTLSLANTDITATYVTVDAKYDPVGTQPAVYTAGTEAKKIAVKTRPVDRLELTSTVEKRDQKLGTYTDDQTKDRMGETIQQQYSAKYGFNANDTVNLVANRKDVTNPALSVSSGNHEVDTTEYDGQLDVNVGPTDFRTDFMARQAGAFTDVVDRENMTKKYNRNGYIRNTYKPLPELSLYTNYAQNLDDEFSEIRKSVFSKSYGEVLRYTPWTIDTSIEYSAADYRTEQSSSNVEYDVFKRSIGKDRKQIFNFTFRRPQELSDPFFEEFFVHFDDTYTSIQADVYNQKPNVARADNFSSTIRPYDIASLGFEDHYTRGMYDNLNREEYMKSNVYRVSRVYPFKYLALFNPDMLIINKFELTKRTDERRREAVSTEILSTYGKDIGQSTLQSYTLNPFDFMVINYQQENGNTERIYDEFKSTSVVETVGLEPKYSYTAELEAATDSLWGLSLCKYNWTRTFADTKVHKTVKDSLLGTALTKDDLQRLQDNMTASYKYWTAFTNNHELTFLDELKTKTGEGLRLSQGKTDALDIRYDTPITGLGLTYGLTRVFNMQYKNTSTSLNRYSVQHSYNDKLLRWENRDKIKADYTPVAWFTADASYHFNTIVQRITSGALTPTASYVSNQIKSKAYEFGVTFRPIEDFNSRYGWTYSVFDLGWGEESKLTAEYKPMKFEYGEVKYNFENTFTYGKGTNDPEQEYNMNDLQGYVQTKVIDRKDIRVTNTLTVRINRDIANVILNNILIDINLTRLHLWDLQNPEYSFSVNAFYAKGTMNF